MCPLPQQGPSSDDATGAAGARVQGPGSDTTLWCRCRCRTWQASHSLNTHCSLVGWRRTGTWLLPSGVVHPSLSRSCLASCRSFSSRRDAFCELEPWQERGMAAVFCVLCSVFCVLCSVFCVLCSVFYLNLRCAVAQVARTLRLWCQQRLQSMVPTDSPVYSTVAVAASSGTQRGTAG